jgi:hypothetical protein
MTVDFTTGGKRDRLIRDAVAGVVKDGIDSLGWLSGTRKHLPINWRDEAITETDTVVPLNTITLVSDSERDEERELGTNATEDRWSFWVDFYAENEDIGREMIGDVRDILRGKYPSIGRTAPVVLVYDPLSDPPELLFGLEIENVEPDRPPRQTQRPFEQFWFTCSFDVVDERD